MGKGLPVYTFSETCEEDGTIRLNDGTHKYFFNAMAAGLSEDVEIRAILDYIMKQKVSDTFTEKIQQFVDNVKADERAKGEYMIESLAIQDSKREGRKEGRKEGKMEAKLEDARKLLELNCISIEQISYVTGLTIEQIQDLQQ